MQAKHLKVGTREYHRAWAQFYHRLAVARYQTGEEKASWDFLFLWADHSLLAAEQRTGNGAKLGWGFTGSREQVV